MLAELVADPGAGYPSVRSYESFQPSYADLIRSRHRQETGRGQQAFEPRNAEACTSNISQSTDGRRAK